ncbi:GNAT family N-acetyltransferase [Tateyamaria sp. syn59]|uniref:GNAT family N-acetyltransferase n=1 Tax=Tateyamaria sp. syn59 TaxID=2576942 RepID=UPI0011BF1C6B|nr:GNAT family N-acetyltransferase [Tateyamaria sp. syn59]
MAQDTCALRLAHPADAPWIEAFLADYADTSMFLRSNLAAHGLEPSADGHATEMFVQDRGDAVRGVLGLSNSGYLMAQMPYDGDIAPARAHWQGRSVLGMTGVPEQAVQVQAALGLSNAPASLVENEPLYTLDLADLAGPFDILRATRADDAEMLETWFFNYRRDTGSTGTDEAAWAEARARTRRALDGTGTRIPERDGQPVAMTTFNAQVADIVQVGGVFVSRALRNKGYGRRVVAAHLAEARARGVTRAILFAASATAARAYEGIGFRRIGAYRVVLFEPPATIKGAT